MRRWLTTALLALSVSTALAGRPCEEKPLSMQELTQGLNLAQLTAQRLNASGAQVVLLARAGQDLSKYGLIWSHLGLAYKTEYEGRPVWRVLHKLNHCGTADAGIYRQGLGEFFLDRPHRYEAAYVVLSPAMQAQLLPWLNQPQRLMVLHEPRYSMLAYPWSTRYQQSNQWVLEALALAADTRLQDRAQAQAWLKAHDYRPSDLKLSTVTRLGARVSMANIAFDDHPSARRFSGHIETITVDSMFAWLSRAGLSEPAVFIKP
ncbi:DUF2145 domain-containing protein [Paucibacter sp. APW11]|uniref:DUF2145 domain-containing protein n=1 Tax=Roseateles aquae TaxID=3077235 RepID=A0ABU3PGM7_9BURK|nr:DUF2145 domain-containing protein [Paucibacter sp. APW11]MDT9001727.1 DUF2145 domain-containing protein [Paucibacter sp. APW11]